MAARTVTLITGANGGIGFEIAAQLIADSTKSVIIGSRSAKKGEAALKDLQARGEPGKVEMVQLDVTDSDSINAAVKHVESEHGRLDALVNNAGVASFPDTTPIQEQMRVAYETNAIGPVLVTEAFAPLLQKSATTARIVNVSSGAGSIAQRLDPKSPIYNVSAIQYRASKAGMNMVTADQAARYGQQGMKVFAFCPGFTVSNLSEMNKAENGAKPTSEGTRPIVDILNGKRDAEHAKFLYGTDGVYSW